MSEYTRVVLSPFSDTGIGQNGSDTGPHCWGELMQVVWDPSDGDSGGDLVLSQVHGIGDTGPGDTGDELIFFNDNDCLGSGFRRMPRIITCHPEGVDTGRNDLAPVVFAGEKPKAKFLAGQAECAGSLILWFRK